MRSRTFSLAEKRPPLPHGGRLRAAAARFGIPLADWIDLSTGINPNGWPVPTVPSSIWNRLPEDDDGLEAAARTYYGTASLLPVAGTQAAIQALPSLIAPSHVSVLHPGYGEHAHAWTLAGHQVTRVSAPDLAHAVPQSDVVVLVNPNNPTGVRFAPEQLQQWHAQLAARGGWLVVDEAFMDATPDESIAPISPQRGLVVLRSLGKFFGLAGARVGFVCAENALLTELKNHLGPWTVPSPSRWVATRALADVAWQQATRERLAVESTRLAALLTQHGLRPHGGCALFQWVVTPQAAMLHEALARLGILTRLFDEPLSLRFGLPGTESAWTRLDAALASVCERAVVETAT